MPRLLRMLSAITEHELDRGTDYFQPSNLEVTTIDVGNTATNVIPGIANAVFNIRFNDLHTSASLEKWLRETFDAVGGKYDLRVHVTGEAFLTEPGPFSDLISTSIERVIGRKPGTLHHRRHFGCPLHQGLLPGGGVRADQPDHAQG